MGECFEYKFLYLEDNRLPILYRFNDQNKPGLILISEMSQLIFYTNVNTKMQLYKCREREREVGGGVGGEGGEIGLIMR